MIPPRSGTHSLFGCRFTYALSLRKHTVQCSAHTHSAIEVTVTTMKGGLQSSQHKQSEQSTRHKKNKIYDYDVMVDGVIRENNTTDTEKVLKFRRKLAATHLSDSTTNATRSVSRHILRLFRL